MSPVTKYAYAAPTIIAMVSSPIKVISTL